jgi:DGQHR domain-containing protein
MTYGKYSDFRIVLATSFEIRSKDEVEAKKDPRVYLWDKTFIEYYEDLLTKIPEHTKFNLLGEMSVKPRVKHIVQVPCFRVRKDGVKLYLFLEDPKEILKWAYVARREIGREMYYQRWVIANRLQNISDYIDKEGGFFPNAPIIAFGVEPQFDLFPEVAPKFPKWDSELEFGCLSFPGTYRSCWIIDGQHRLYGLSQSKTKKHLMPFVALEGTQRQDQAKLFLDINKNQKPVPPDLTWDLEGEMRPQSADGIISRVAKELNKKGVLAGKIYVPLLGPIKRSQLRLAGVCSSIKKQKITERILQYDQIANPLFDENPDRLVKSVSKCLNSALTVLDQTFKDWQKEGFWLRSAGIPVFVALFERIVGHRRKIPGSSDFKKYLAPLKGYMERHRGKERMKILRERCASWGGRAEVAAEFARVIRDKTKDSKFAQDIPEFEFEKRLKQVERGLANLLAKKLGKVEPNWFKRRVSHEIRENVLKTKQKDKTVGGPIQDFMSIGEVGGTLVRSDNWEDLKKRIVGRRKFASIEEVRMAFATINRLRGRLEHGRADLEAADESLLDGYLTKFETVIRMGSS